MLGADPRRALVLYGRVATYGRRAQTMSHAEPGNIGFWRKCAQTIEEQVLKHGDWQARWTFLCNLGMLEK